MVNEGEDVRSFWAEFWKYTDNYEFLTIAASSDYRCENKEFVIDSNSHTSE